MIGFLRWHRRSLPVLVVLGVLASTPSAGRETVVRVGLPLGYETQIQRLASAPARCNENSSACVRYRYAQGTDYQLLDWLQNGKIDGAVVPAMTVELMRRAVGARWGAGAVEHAAGRFESEFLVKHALPLNDLALRRYQVALRAEKDGKRVADSDAQLEDLFQALLGDPKGQDVSIELRSHLSPGIPFLYARVRKWLDGHEERRSDESKSKALDRVVEGLVDRFEFSVVPHADLESERRASLRFVLDESACSAGASACLNHLFLVRRQALPGALGEGKGDTPPLGQEREFLDYAAGAADRLPADSSLRRFGSANYVSETAGWRNRYRFAFTLDELHGILRGVALDDTGDDGIALVLTGGGVKAAYQTKLIDHLYGKGYLRNRFAESTDQAAVPVKYVIGTSGGALLGIFVASLGKRDPELDLSTKLWRRHEDGQPRELLSSIDVFPKVDLMRWLSFLWCLVVFWVACAAFSFVRRLRGEAPAVIRDGTPRFRKFTVWWLILLIVAPWLVKYADGHHAAEHIPAIEGVFYFFFGLIAVYSDNRLVTRSSPREGARDWRPVAAMICGTALAIVALPLSHIENEGFEAFFRVWQITVPALTACAGLLSFALGLHFFFKLRARWLEPLPEPPVRSALALLAGVGPLTYLLFFAVVAAGLASVFELTLKFWIYLGALALLVSVALLYLAYGKGAPSAAQRHLRPRVDFLMAEHPSHRVAHARYSRIILVFTAGWFWWNLVVAPGMYGNHSALGYFRDAARNVFGKAAVGADRDTTLNVEFHAFYAAPVTALEKRVERYVMFQPPQAYAPGASVAALGGYRSWLSIANDPRWLTIENAEKQRELLMRVAFASGSPFPVFPAHRIGLPGIGDELLVDGGYAHNVPVEAAKRLGARRVLVLNSSPREPVAKPAAKVEAKVAERVRRVELVGNMIWMLRWLAPYFYERSQVEDALSAEDIIVASVAPSGDPRNWPLLTDFRAEVIQRMFDESRKDLTLRTGSIESWGRPAFTPRSTPQAR